MQVISFSQKEGFTVIEEPTLDVGEDVTDDVGDDEFFRNRGFAKRDWAPVGHRDDVDPVVVFYSRMEGAVCPWEFVAVFDGFSFSTYIVAKDSAELLALQIALSPLCHSQQLDSLISDMTNHVKSLEGQIQSLDLK